jgi:hypothetical protein
MDPMTMMAIVKTGLPLLQKLAGGVSSGGGVMPQSQPGKFQLDIENSMARDPSAPLGAGMLKGVSLGGESGPGDDGKPGGGLPPWMDKLGAGLQVGEALRPQMPRPPSLPGGGRFGQENSLLKYLQMMGRR